MHLLSSPLSLSLCTTARTRFRLSLALARYHQFAPTSNHSATTASPATPCLLPGGLGRAGTGTGDMAIPVEEAIAALSTFSLEVRALGPSSRAPAPISRLICATS